MQQTDISKDAKKPLDPSLKKHENIVKKFIRAKQTA